MGLQEGLILLGAVVFVLVLLDALRRKRAARRQADDDYEDPEEAERRAQIARELPGIRDEDARNSAAQQELDPLFDKIEVFDDDPIPVLRNKLSPADESMPQDQQNKHQQPAFSEVDTDDDPQAENEWAEAETSLHHQPRQEEDEELAWERMRRQFELDPDFVAESKRSMQEQQRELQRLQDRKQLHTEPDADEPQAFEYENNLDDQFQSLDDLVDLELPAGMQSTHSTDRAAAPAEETPALTAAELEAYQSEDDTEDQENHLRAAFLMNVEKSAWAVAEEFLTINVQAPDDKPFPGSHLRKFMDIIGMRLSLSGFYHYVEEKNGQSVLGFSLVNMFAPGCFEDEQMSDFSTAGLVLVMPLPNARQPMAVFERMLATARVMEKHWGAELQDEQRSNLTQQTVEHYRQRIKDFEHQTRLKARKAGKT
ncbi:MAG: hypothetical protein IBX50_00975 [Marinospirillum sp.]|uniref:cell division protein ZipA C-terminal FtsZ-binding domain-containing protein n=1 Tax=Marinospirillum sp. TaxID=2183934 RepID=UPI0019E4DDA2|nr:cell division protein ZipA C-terminal FtsZ-binding domain-containing protein [Marinospirillum sp.]MBE0505274.1 hypothetical protein [Marinospirillum sp.]